MNTRSRILAGFSASILVALSLLTTRVLGQGQYQTLGTGSCGLDQNKCHAADGDWWYDDPHSHTAEPLLDENKKYAQIASNYRLTPTSNMSKGNQNCMGCHGTIISGEESDDVLEGVSCESCHGPGSGYLDSHQEGDKKLLRDRPGYKKALKDGLVELADVNTRADACVDCHYIIDEKLLSAGHPSGQGFDYAGKGIRGVSKHWNRGVVDEDTDVGPYERGEAKKGPIPEYTLVGGGPQGSAGAGSTGIGGGTGRTRTVYVNRPLPPGPFIPPTALKNLTLPPFPKITASTPPDSVLLILKMRLELLYKTIYARKK